MCIAALSHEIQKLRPGEINGKLPHSSVCPAPILQCRPRSGRSLKSGQSETQL